ncbi:glycosyltransferase family 10 [Planktomarina temperata]|nr:glycosyltransferase family 10 [Planktomarina temperata]
MDTTDNSAAVEEFFHPNKQDFLKEEIVFYVVRDHIVACNVSMDDKLESLRDYRFHIAIENSSYDGYFTEKITDCFLAGTYPIYYGCKNLDQYFQKTRFYK